LSSSFDRSWVERHAECAAGMSWGLEYVKNGGKDLEAALPGFDRADWLLWFCFRAGAIPDLARSTRDLVAVNLPREFKRALELAREADRAGVAQQIREDAATEAYTASSLGKLRDAYAFETAGFLALMTKARELRDVTKEILYAQAAVLSLVGAIAGKKHGDDASRLAHNQLSEQIRDNVARRTR
jgi:hypothetical protein